MTAAAPGLVLASAVLASCGGTVTHQTSSRVHVYGDERITAISPAVQERAKVRDTTVTAGYAADVVSGATQVLTADAISSATWFSDRRHQIGLGAGHAISPEREVSAGYGFSTERDHDVHAPSVGYAQELFDRAAKASIRYQWLFEQVGRSDAPSYAQRSRAHRLDAGWTQILTRTLVLTVLVTTTGSSCAPMLGCFANPYRYVGVTRGFDLVALSERHPATRLTGAGATRLSWAFAREWALHAGYRLAQDSWSVTAHTVDASLVTELFGKRLLVRAEARATVQDGAAFYRSRYESGDSTIPAFRTADAELSSLWNLRTLLQLEWRVDPARLVLQVGRMWNRYPEFRSFPARDAWIGGLGIDLEL